MKAWHEEHRVQENAKSNARYHANRDEIRSALRERYATDPEFRAKYRPVISFFNNLTGESRSAWTASHAWVIEAANNLRRLRTAKLSRDSQARIRMFDPDGANRRSVQYAHRRRARLRDNSSPGVTLEQWDEIVEVFGRRCAYCLRHESECGKMTREHVIAISRGGRDEPDNTVPACGKCNSKKSHRSVFVMLH